MATSLSTAPDGLLQFYFIRHGQTEWSLSGQHTGRTDLALTTQGEEEARELGPRLRAIRFCRVLTSPLLRARRTCELAGLAPKADIEPDLAKWDYGDYEGMRSVDIRHEHPGWNVFRDGRPGGETSEAIRGRADRLIGRLGALRGNVALFFHGQFGCVLAARWIGLPVLAGQHFALRPASLSVLGHEESHPDVRVIALWNSVVEPT